MNQSEIAVGARSLYGDEQIDITGAGEKVRELIEEHVYSTGVDSKISKQIIFSATSGSLLRLIVRRI